MSEQFAKNRRESANILRGMCVYTEHRREVITYKTTEAAVLTNRSSYLRDHNDAGRLNGQPTGPECAFNLRL